jgi:O-acetyl-ADP-ribose deacetylase (regulator of RNase III)
MTEIQGNLLTLADQGKFTLIAHGANCFHTMGAGIALQIAKKWPEALKADKKTPKGRKSKLGTLSHATVTTQNQTDLVIVNAYTQFGWGSSKNAQEQEERYTAIRNALKALRTQFQSPTLKIGLPLIGAGLAGGDWKVIKTIFEEELKGLDVTVVHFAP